MGGCSIKDLSDADRAWAVVRLSEMGWTAQDIADRMGCSLRLIRNIKAEPLAAAMEYAILLRAEISALHGVHRLELDCIARIADAQLRELSLLRAQRSDLILQLQIERQRAAEPLRRTPRKKIP